jgi:hypothetical protein
MMVFMTLLLTFARVTGGTALSSGLNMAANSLNAEADVANTTANLSLTEFGWDCCLQDWQ